MTAGRQDNKPSFADLFAAAPPRNNPGSRPLLDVLLERLPADEAEVLRRALTTKTPFGEYLWTANEVSRRLAEADYPVSRAAVQRWRAVNVVD